MSPGFSPVAVQSFLNTAEPLVILCCSADNLANEPAHQILRRLVFIAVVVQKYSNVGDGVGRPLAVAKVPQQEVEVAEGLVFLDDVEQFVRTAAAISTGISPSFI